MDVLGQLKKRRRHTAVACASLAFFGCATASASTWTTGLAASSKGLGRSESTPAAPSNVDSTCSLVALKVTVSWDAVPHANLYTVYQSSNGANGTYSSVAIVSGTSWSSGVLVLGTYYYKVTATVGTNWVSPLSNASPGHTITVVLCT